MTDKSFQAATATSGVCALRQGRSSTQDTDNDKGKVGKQSAAARFAAATPSDFSIQEEKPYAELWMGTHPSNPSKDLQTQRTLLDLVQDNEALMSKEISEKYQKKLPFLFKVLSVNKALSIQAHPNKKLAEKLHQKDSKNYPDDNHKPEMALAITPFDGLCGFRPLNEISHFLDNVPSLKSLVGEDKAAQFQKAIKGQETTEDESKTALQAAFTSLMESKPEDIEKQAKILIQQAKDEGDKFAGNGGPSNSGKELADLMLRLDSQFPNDIGIFVSFFLNYVKLEVGEAMFLKADDIHAYLSGGTSPHSPHKQPSQANAKHRHHRMHGLLRQRRPRRLHPKIQGRQHLDLHANLLLRPHQRAKNVTNRLPLRHAQHNSLQILLHNHTLRSSHRRI